MDIHNSYTDLPAEAQGCVIAIGNFDGVHSGHARLLSIAHNKAKDTGRPLGVLTFEPHPRKLFRPDDPPFRITPQPLKARRLQHCNVDHLFNVNFNWDFASQSAGSFVENVLQNGLKPSHVVVGYDFCFGQLRKGTPKTIKDAGFPVTVVEKIDKEDGTALSSSQIRLNLRHGHIAEANDLLGWDWEIEGIVVEGDKRGRELGFPTANVSLGDALHPAYGIYAAWVKIAEDGPGAEWLPSAVNVGIRPMFELEIGQLEAHILDFNRDIYGKTLRTRPVERLRGEARFENLNELIEQIGKDCQNARKALNIQGNYSASQGLCSRP